MSQEVAIYVIVVILVGLVMGAILEDRSRKYPPVE